MPDIKSFCDGTVIKTSDASCVIKDSFDNFAGFIRCKKALEMGNVPC